MIDESHRQSTLLVVPPEASDKRCAIDSDLALREPFLPLPGDLLDFTTLVITLTK